MNLRLFAVLGIVALLAALVFPSVATNTGGIVEGLNAPLVTYRMSGVALVPNGDGRLVEFPLADAPLGAGSRIRYLLIASNATKEPQVAGVSIRIPEYTVWNPPLERNPSDIVQWTIDKKHWHRGRPDAGDIKRVRVIRWISGDYLRPGMSTAFVFELRLTGPYSDRTGDLNATRDPAAQPVTELRYDQIEHAQSTILHIGRAIAEPLGLAAPLERSPRLGDGSARIVVRNGVRYSVKAIAYVADADGDVHAVPLAAAHPKPNDRIRFTFTAYNTAHTPKAAGAAFELPGTARFGEALSTDGSLEISDDGMHWRALTATPTGAPRNVRYVHHGRLMPGASGGFLVDVVVIEPPAGAPAPKLKGDDGSLDALSASAIQSFFFTRAIESGRRTSYDGFPLTAQVDARIKRPAGPGFVTSGATPMPTPMPYEAREFNQRSNLLLIVAGGTFLFFTLFIFLQMRATRGNQGDPSVMRGSYKSAPAPAPTTGKGELARETLARGTVESDIGRASAEELSDS